MALSRQAVDMARNGGDRSTLAAALLHTQWATWSPDNLEERLETASEALRLADAEADETLALQARVWKLNHLLELCRVEAVDEEFDACAKLAERLRQPYSLWQVTTLRAMRDLLEGRLAEAERQALDALAVGQEAQNRNAVQLFGVQLLALRREQGRFAELEEPLESFVGEYPTLPWAVALALLHAEHGRTDEARRELDVLAEEGFGALRRNMFWLPAIALCAEACALAGHSGQAEPIYELLLPYAGRCLVLAPVVASYGSVERFLGLAATTMGSFDRAEVHFERALVDNAKLRARPWVGHVQHDYARMLLTRSDAGDEPKALALLDRAATTAAELDMRTLLDRTHVTRLAARGIRADILPGLA
jgi:tetratricopeptide (TPR) repeat protein